MAVKWSTFGQSDSLRAVVHPRNEKCTGHATVVYITTLKKKGKKKEKGHNSNHEHIKTWLGESLALFCGAKESQ